MKTTDEIIHKLSLNYHLLRETKEAMKRELKETNGNTKKEMIKTYYLVSGQFLATKEMLDFIGGRNV